MPSFKSQINQKFKEQSIESFSVYVYLALVACNLRFKGLPS